MNQSHDVVVIGAGSAGLSISHELTRAGREHVVLDRAEVAHSWRARWDSFALVLPNWAVRLAGAVYAGSEPDGFMPRDQFVDHLTSYARSFAAPVQEGVDVMSLTPGPGGFALETSIGPLTAREVVVATGGFQQSYRPAATQQIPASVQLLDAAEYRNPGSLPAGEVLVIGSGQTGCQLAEELLRAGRTVYLACGKAPWAPRRIGAHDAFWWLSRSAFMQQTTADLPSPLARLAPNPQLTGRDGGQDLNYRTLQAAGVILTGHLSGVEDGRLHFADDLADSVAFGDARYGDICQLVTNVAAQLGEPVPDLPVPAPFIASAPASVPVRNLGAAIVSSGYRPNYKSWIQVPEAFDEMGLPLQEDGSSTVVPGLHFMGVPFQRRRGSSSLFGVGSDAEALAERMESPTAVT